jgi:hypothetical protein
MGTINKLNEKIKAFHKITFKSRGYDSLTNSEVCEIMGLTTLTKDKI